MPLPVFKPYPHQEADLAVLGQGCRRNVWVWHRRAGKDMAAFLGWMIPEAFRKTGVYFYVFPTYSQGKKIVWDNIDSSGHHIMHYIGGYMGLDSWKQAKDLIGLNETELQITLPPVHGGSSGSIIQIVGTDNLDRVVGTNPVGLILSEYPLQKDHVWSYLQPILEANGGWAIFAYTPRGDNHGHKLYQMACHTPGWHASIKTVLDTAKFDGSPIITAEQIDELRAQGISEDIIQQEYFCSFTGAQSGSYYSHLIAKAREEGRIRPNLYDPTLPVDTFWDLGQSDTTVIGFRQTAYNERRWIDCYANNRQGLDHYAHLLTEKSRTLGYRYRMHHFPHDIAVREFTTNESRLAAASRLGIRPNTVVPKRPLFEGIDAVRRAFSRYWFDSSKCSELISALATYHKKWDKQGVIISDTPAHTPESHYADMIRYEAVVGTAFTRDTDEPVVAVSTFDPFTFNENDTRWDPLS